jgi:hypothetical protein
MRITIERRYYQISGLSIRHIPRTNWWNEIIGNQNPAVEFPPTLLACTRGSSPFESCGLTRGRYLILKNRTSPRISDSLQLNLRSGISRWGYVSSSIYPRLWFIYLRWGKTETSYRTLYESYIWLCRICTHCDRRSEKTVRATILVQVKFTEIVWNHHLKPRGHQDQKKRPGVDFFAKGIPGWTN